MHSHGYASNHVSLASTTSLTQAHKDGSKEKEGAKSYCSCRALQPGRILVPHAINTHRSVGRCPRGYQPSPRLRRLTQGARVFPSRFPGASRFPCRFAFPGDSPVLALRFSRRFFCPGGSRFLAIPVFWRFPPGDSQHALSGRGLVVLQLQLKVGSWLLLVPPRRLVCGAISITTVTTDRGSVLLLPPLPLLLPASCSPSRSPPPLLCSLFSASRRVS